MTPSSCIKVIVSASALLSVAIGCGSAPTPPVGPSIALLDGTSVSLVDAEPLERSCLETHCGQQADQAAYDACRLASCAVREATWELVPLAIRFEEGTVFIHASVSHKPGGYGESTQARQMPAFVGVTLVTTEGEELDLAIQTVFAESLDQPFLFSADVDTPIQDVLIGLWDRKIEPCDSERSGCKEYGFLLDGSLATYPPELYTRKLRQRILPESFSLQWFTTGEEEWVDVQQAVGKRLRSELEIFGSTLVVQPPVSEGKGIEEVKGVELRVRHAHDQVLAYEVAESITTLLDTTPIAVRHDPDVSVDMQIIVAR